MEMRKILVRKTDRLVAAFILCLTVLAFPPGCGTERKPAQETVKGNVYSRIISMAPNITETLYALGLGDRVAGVTKFCEYPPEVKNKPNIGGFLDPNYEAIASLRPDMVFLLPEHEKVKNYLEELTIPYCIVHNRSVEDILATIRTIGRKCGCESKADSLITDIQNRIDTIRTNVPKKTSPKVLTVIERELGTGGIRDVYVAGKGTLYDDLITLAGGVNAFSSSDIPYPVVSPEGLLDLNPDYIIDLVSEKSRGTLNIATVTSDWNALSRLKAVQNGNIRIVEADYAFIPGPRFIKLLEMIASIIQDK